MAAPDGNGEEHDVGGCKAGHAHGEQQGLLFLLVLGVSGARIERGDAVAEVADRARDALRGEITRPGNVEPAGGEVQAGVIHAGQRGDSAFDAREAGAAFSAAHGERQAVLLADAPHEGRRIGRLRCAGRCKPARTAGRVDGNRVHGMMISREALNSSPSAAGSTSALNWTVQVPGARVSSDAVYSPPPTGVSSTTRSSARSAG